MRQLGEDSEDHQDVRREISPRSLWEPWTISLSLSKLATITAFPQSVETHMYEERAVVISLECDPSIVKMIGGTIYSTKLYQTERKNELT